MIDEQVDNRYVVAKLKTVLFPVIKKKRWKREELEGLQGAHAKRFAPPSADENAPDLYIPVMSLVTYVVVCSYVKGTNGKFSPEASFTDELVRSFEILSHIP